MSQLFGTRPTWLTRFKFKRELTLLLIESRTP